MIRLATADTWGISPPNFLGLYAALCALAAAAVAAWWRRVLGMAKPTKDPAPDIGAYRVALVSGGPQLAVTAAAANLYRDGVLQSAGRRRTFQVAGELRLGADPLERAIFEAVRRHPGITAGALATELRTSAPITTMESELGRLGLLADAARVGRLRLGIASFGGLLAALGAARIYAGAQGGKPIGFLVIAVIAVLVATSVTVRRRPAASAGGRDLLRRLRSSRRGGSHAAESAMAIALFGAGALWLADPVSAAALGVRRDSGYFPGGSGAGGGGCGGGGCGGGGCGGGGCGGGCGG